MNMSLSLLLSFSEFMFILVLFMKFWEQILCGQASLHHLTLRVHLYCLNFFNVASFLIMKCCNFWFFIFTLSLGPG